MPDPRLPPDRSSFHSAARVFERAYLAHLAQRRRPRRRPGRERDGGGVPVEPDRPNSLSGGAAAELDFEGA